MLTQSFCPDWFVSDHILVGEGIREAVAFVGHQLEESPWAAGRQLQMDRVLGTEDSGASSWFGFGGKVAPAPVAAPFWIRAIMHFTKGSALVGIVSVFYSFVGQSLTPDQLRVAVQGIGSVVLTCSWPRGQLPPL